MGVEVQRSWGGRETWTDDDHKNNGESVLIPLKKKVKDDNTESRKKTLSSKKEPTVSFLRRGRKPRRKRSAGEIRSRGGAPMTVWWGSEA